MSTCVGGNRHPIGWPGLVMQICLPVSNCYSYINAFLSIESPVSFRQEYKQEVGASTQSNCRKRRRLFPRQRPNPARLHLLSLLGITETMKRGNIFLKPPNAARSIHLLAHYRRPFPRQQPNPAPPASLIFVRDSEDEELRLLHIFSAMLSFVILFLRLRMQRAACVFSASCRGCALSTPSLKTTT